MSLPLYPTFKKLELSDKEIFEEHTKKFPPYSDYNFVSIWSYNTEDNVTFSFLNDNLVMKLNDYITNEPFYTFLGTNKAEETINNLLILSDTENVIKNRKILNNSDRLIAGTRLTNNVISVAMVSVQTTIFFLLTNSYLF